MDCQLSPRAFGKSVSIGLTSPKRDPHETGDRRRHSQAKRERANFTTSVVRPTHYSSVPSGPTVGGTQGEIRSGRHKGTSKGDVHPLTSLCFCGGKELRFDLGQRLVSLLVFLTPSLLFLLARAVWPGIKLLVTELVDYGLFHPLKSKKIGSLWVSEQALVSTIVPVRNRTFDLGYKELVPESGWCTRGRRDGVTKVLTLSCAIHKQERNLE